MPSRAEVTSGRQAASYTSVCGAPSPKVLSYAKRFACARFALR